MVKRGPWTMIKEEVRYNSPWIEVSQHEVIDPGGSSGIYGVVHFRNIAIGVIPMDEAGNTWIVGQYRYPVQAYSWEIVEGGGSRDIDPIISARRELREEAGIEASQWDEILRMDLSNSASDERAIIYLARGLSFVPAEPDHNEELELKKLPFEDLYAMVLRGDLVDSLTVAAVLKLKLLLLEGKVDIQK